MKFVAGVVMISAVAGVVWAQSGSSIDLSSPTAAIQSFITASNNRNTVMMRKCVLNPTPSTKTDKFIEFSRINLQFSVSEYSDVTILNNTATAVLNLKLIGETNTLSQKELVLLKRSNSEWKIDADATVRLSFDPNKPDAELPKYMLGAMATLASGDERFLAGVESSFESRDAESCLRQLKILSLSTGMYQLDHDEVLPPFESWFTSIKPYNSSPDTSRCPKDYNNSFSYSMNKALDRKPLAVLDDPKTTVLIYEGKDGILDFRHQGKAGICFADPETPCKLVTPEESKKLNWKVHKPYFSESTAKRPVLGSTTNPQIDQKKVNHLEHVVNLLSAKVKNQANTISIQAKEIQSLKTQLAKKKSVSVVPPSRPTRPVVRSTAAWRSLTMGMSKAGVKRLLGDPDSVFTLGEDYYWDYGGGQVGFNGYGEVKSWREPLKLLSPPPRFQEPMPLRINP